MTTSFTRIGVALSLVALVACGPEKPSASQLGGDPAAQGETIVAASQPVRACELVDLTTATRVIGSGTEHPGGDTEQETCMYVNPGVAMLTIQIGRAELYDQITILPPHTPAQIGERGRHTVQPTGTVAVQFVKGRYSVTLSTQPLSASDSAYLDALLATAREAANRLP